MSKRPCADCILSELDMFELVQAIGRHGIEIKTWLAKPERKPRAALSGRDVRLADFDPLDSWSGIIEMIADAERRATKFCEHTNEVLRVKGRK